MTINNEFNLPQNQDDQNKRNTARHLPSFFRSDSNKKFLGGTLDPLMQPGKLTRVNAYVGRRDVPNFDFSDNYIEETSTPRQYYQLEPSYVYQDPIKKETQWYADYLDYINSIKYFGGPVANHSRLNKQEAYTWDPHIDWDKIVNYREYYWLPGGPDPVTIFGELEAVESTYDVTLEQQGNNSTFKFSTQAASVVGLSNPRLTLYRGLTYTFIINAPGKQFSIKTEAKTGDGYFYNIGVSQQKITQGILTWTIPEEAPDLLYYIDNNDLNTLGMIDIKNISEVLVLDVEAEILGKKSFVSSSGIQFVNGLKIKFSGNVTPAKYAEGFWYVENVGNAIKLINYSDLETPAIYGSTLDLPFDEQPFDSVPFETAANYPQQKDYITISRASKDRNTWSRNNRWFSRTVLETTASANGAVANLDQASRAIRPIIEFFPDIKLFQYGWKSKQDIDYIDNFTTDVFSTIEGSISYKIDGNNSILAGQRIIFIADTDPLVNGKIFEVKEIENANENRIQITLQPTEDSEPTEGDVVYVTKGDNNKGCSYYYFNGTWNLAQKKTRVNQPPLFDLFDESMISYADSTVYTHTNFPGNAVFSYKVGTGSNDTELGFPISYMNISNIGDIEFEFNLETQTWNYQSPSANILFDTVQTVHSYSGFLRLYKDDGTFAYMNGWVKTVQDLTQSVVRILKINSPTDLIAIDVYDNSGALTDMRIRVYVNDKKVEASKLSLEIINGTAYVRFNYLLSAGDKLLYKVKSLANKNLKGYYEIPSNWQNNPLNSNVSTFTFGEVVDHVHTIIEDVSAFSGEFPGISNLANLGYVTNYGKKFLQHSGSLPLASYLMTDENANVVRALRWAAKKYSEFKKEFLRLAQTNSYEGTISDIVDQILLDYSRSKYVDTSAFHFSDMSPYGAASVREYTVVDPRLPVFVIDSVFNPMSKTKRSVLVYKNDTQLVYKKDYVFDSTDAFVDISTALAVGDVITIKDYASTDGCYIPITPSKLGLYPAYVPEIYLDNTYVESTYVIQGHDGSIIKAYGDYRDDLIIEFEKRIFNNRRVEYDTSIFNIHSVIGSYYFKGEFSKSEINDIMLVDFLNWNSVIDQDFLTNNYYIDENSFTYNYGRSTAPNGTEVLLGHWRGIYKFFYDTDRPHTHPWEMQGFSIKPDWWDTVYGPAPYTSENKILWNSIETGLIRDPNNRRTIVRYKRPGILSYIPVDDQGKLLSPLDSGLARDFALITGKSTYMFGDQAPVETAWRRSSEYAFSAIVCMCVLRGAEFIGKMWDRFSIKRNIANQIYYEPTKNRMQLSDLIFSDVALGDTNDPNVLRTQTSGLSNFIEEYVFMQKYVNIDLYKTHIKNLDAKLSYRIGGFTSKEKVKILLDSRSPNASGTIFLPEENYSIFYNKSFPVTTVTYSGVLIEKLGLSLPNWESNKKYKRDDKIIYQSQIYRCLTQHISDNTPVSDLPSPNTDASVQRFNIDLIAGKWEKISTYQTGYKIRGYDTEKNYFEIYPPRNTASDPKFNVGGVSESYVDWAPNTSSTQNATSPAASKYYAKGQIVRLDGQQYYKAKIGHSSSATFEQDIEKWQLLAGLPLTGGRSALKRTKFEDTIYRIPYGTVFTTIQNVVDFLFGYQKRLEEHGFEFDDFNNDLSLPLDWFTSAKEFLFWTLQNWNDGSVITLSPAATLLKYKSTSNTTIDGFVSDLHDYSIFKADGSPLKNHLTDVYRDSNGFTIKPSDGSSDGIFHVRANAVYKEHVLILDNRSIFNDVIYDVVPGYRQGRVKLLGFKTSNWDGGYTSPGFVYDQAIILDWAPNTDYAIGDVVKYKDYYFTAIDKVFGSTQFIYEQWTKLKDAPTPGLIPNFDYKVEQFRDFYNLDASIYDKNQQDLARHLIGYQPREYLDNIIIDDVSQYKFYQGFIKEKGTYNSISKLFDALRSSGFSTVDIKEEWAIKLGDYGAADAYGEVEFPLSEEAFRYNPQNIVLTKNSTEFNDLSIYNVTSNMLTIKPSMFDGNIFGTTKLDLTQNDSGVFKYPVAGYVRDTDVDHILFNEAALLNYDITLFSENDKIWLGFNSTNDWDILEFFNLKTLVTNWSIQGNIVTLECNRIPLVAENDILVLKNLDSLDGSYKVQKVYNNFIEIFTFNTALYHLQEDSTHGLLYKISSVRYNNSHEIVAKQYDRPKIKGEKLWIDSGSDGKWMVLENKDVFTKSEIPSILNVADQHYGSNVKLSKNKFWMFISMVDNKGGAIVVYNRYNVQSDWEFVQTLRSPYDLFYSESITEKFGTSVDVTDDGMILVVGVPNASNVLGRYKSTYSPYKNYSVNELVSYDNKIWRCVRTVSGSFVPGTDATVWEESLNQGAGSGSRTTISINTVARVSNKIIVKTVGPHNLSEGDIVSVTGVTINYVNVNNAIVTDVVNETTFKYFYADDPFAETAAHSGLVISPSTAQGAVIVYRYNRLNTEYKLDTVLLSHQPSTKEGFGNKVKIVNDGVNYWLHVAAKNYSNNRGRVHLFKNTLKKLLAYQTFGLDNLVYISSSTNIEVGMPIVFDGTEFGNIVIGTVYYVKNIKSENYIQISATKGGAIFDLIDGSGVMNVEAGGWTYSTQRFLDPGITLNADEQYGYDLDVSQSGRYAAITAPYRDEGSVFVFEKIDNAYSLVETIDAYTLQHTVPNLIGSDAYLSLNDQFGRAVAITDTDLLVTCPDDDYSGTNVGSVYHFDKITGTLPFRLRQIIVPPVALDSERFGLKVAVSASNDVLAVSSGGSNYIEVSFDSYSDRLVFDDEHLYNYELDTTSTATTRTTFDTSSTMFYEITAATGAVYVYNKIDNDYIYGDKLHPDQTLAYDDNFGASIDVTDDCIIVGAPNRHVNNIREGNVYRFDYTDISWSTIASQDSIIDVSKFKKAYIYNTATHQMIENVDFYDPAKGFIPKAADQEIRYQTPYDPATYQYSLNTELKVDQTGYWTDDHVGEVWWDLSRLKYTWYEQGDSTYRNNNWGRLFVGSTVDVYEWVESPYLPSRWAMLADTEQGLALGISGVPREIDDFTYSSKFKYDPINATKITTYYFWVKNKTTIPNVRRRLLSVANVANLILDPKAQGYSYVSITSSNSLSLTNVNTKLINEDISLNLQYYKIDNTDLAVHRQYSIIADEDATSYIHPYIENKWFDSLIGHNTNNLRVPDPFLSTRQRYGILNEPRQSWFINRYEALKQFIDYLNAKLRTVQIADSINFNTLNSAAPEPTLNSGEVDTSIDIIEELRFIGLSDIRTAKLSVRISEGRIINVFVDDSGYGYGRNKVYSKDIAGTATSWYGPTTTIYGNGYDAELQTVVDIQGKIIDVVIVRAGSGYDSDSTIVRVRDFTVLVKTDSEARNGWSLHTYDFEKNNWYRIKTQSYDVKRYWKYVDWYAEGFSVSSDVNYLIENTYELGQLSAKLREVVKVNNAGNGNWLLLERVDTTNGPDYTTDYIVVGRENATIQFSDSLYNLSQDLGYDVIYGYDNNLYDQNPTTELRLILQAVRDDVLIDELRIEYIRLFFNSLHYVLTEQPYADWMFKTSFIKVNHNVGSLKQKKTFQSDVLESYQKFIEEAKPYKTKIREWVSSYGYLESNQNVISDFDLPSHYDETLGYIETVNGNSSNVTTYPWKNWLDNHTYEVVDIIVHDSGKKYTSPPKVIINGGFVDTINANNITASTTDMNAMSNYIELGRYMDTLSTVWPFSTTVPGLYSKWSFTRGSLVFAATGLPYHSYGKYESTNNPKVQDYSVTIPLRAGTNDPAPTTYPVNLGIIGYWLNGVAMFNPSAGSGAPAGFSLPPNGFNYNAAFEAGQELGYSFGEDLAGGHAQENGIYHYHDYSFAQSWVLGIGHVSGSTTSTGKAEVYAIPYLNNSLTHSDGHSKILGWAIDGYPVYGPYGYSSAEDSKSTVRIMETGFTIKAESSRQGTNAYDTVQYPMGIFIQDYEFSNTGDLDVHNGRFCVTPDYPNGTYAYFATIGEKTIDGIKNYVPVYPYVIGTSYYGIPLTDGVNIVPGKGIAPVSVPLVTASNIAEGTNQRNASATAYIANGELYKIVVDDPGYGYISAPTIYISGGNDDPANRAQAYAVIGNTKARTITTGIKFDRYTFSYEAIDSDGNTTFREVDTFSGNGTTTEFKLKYAPEIEQSKIYILVDDIEIFGAQYDVVLTKVKHDNYTALEGTIVFLTAPAAGNNNITIAYDKNISTYAAADRINYAYSPISGQYAKELGQLMTGIDYGGVNLQSIDFDVGGGWDVIPWDVSSWDNVLDTNNDVAFIISNTADRTFTLPYVPEDQEVVNVYIDRLVVNSTTLQQSVVVGSQALPVNSIAGVLPGDIVSFPNYESIHLLFDCRVIAVNKDNVDSTIGTVVIDQQIPYQLLNSSTVRFTRNLSIRVDDPEYDGITELKNPNAAMLPFVGDGIVSDITIPNTVHLYTGEIITFRKTTSDGSILPTDRSLMDSFVDGGSVADNRLSGAAGVLAEEIIIDGDGFVTADTSHGPEELIQGQVVDSLDIKVYHAPTDGGPNMSVKNYTGDGTTTVFSINTLPVTQDAAIVIVDSVLVDFELDYTTSSVVFYDAPVENSKIVIITIDAGSTDVLDMVKFTGDGVTNEFLTAAYFDNGNISVFATINGVIVNATVKESNDTYSTIGNAVVNFDTTPAVGSLVQIMITRGTTVKYSQVSAQYIPLSNTTRSYTLDYPPGNNVPASASVLVVVDGEFLRAPDYANFVYTGETLALSSTKYNYNTLKRADIKVYRNRALLLAGSDYTLDASRNYIVIAPGSADTGDEIIVEILKSNDFYVDGDTINISTSYDLNHKSVMQVTTFKNHDILKVKRSETTFTFVTGYDLTSYDSVGYDTTSNAINANGVIDLPRTISKDSGLFVAYKRRLLAQNVDYKVLENKKQIRVILPDLIESTDYIDIITTNEQTIQPSYGFKIFKDMLNRTHYKVMDKLKTTTLKSDLNYYDTKIEVEDASILDEPGKIIPGGTIKSNIPGVVEINGERIEYFVKDGNFLKQLRRGTLGTGIKSLIKQGSSVADIGQRTTIPYADQEIKKTYFADGLTRDFVLDFVPAITVISATKIQKGLSYKIVSKGTSDFTKIGSASNNTGTLFTATAIGTGTGKVELHIDANYGQCDILEIFVAGTRLRKAPIQIYDASLGSDSYKSTADVWHAAEFSVNGTDNSVRLTEIPPAGSIITIVYKQGKTWAVPSEQVPLRFSQTNVAKFVTLHTVDLPK